MSIPPDDEATWNRVRIVFGKRGPLRFLGQLDIGRTLDRALRRTALPVRFSEGFNPRVRLSFPCAVVTGMASACEVVEIQVRAPCGPAEVLAALREDLPRDLPVLAAEEVPAGERLRLVEAEYRVRPAAGGGGLPGEAELAAFLERDSVPVVRRGREIDLRPLIHAASGDGAGGLRVRIAFAASGATARPSDLLGALGAGGVPVEEERVALTVMLQRGTTTEERRYGA